MSCLQILQGAEKLSFNCLVKLNTSQTFVMSCSPSINDTSRHARYYLLHSNAEAILGLR